MIVKNPKEMSEQELAIQLFGIANRQDLVEIWLRSSPELRVAIETVVSLMHDEEELFPS